MNRPFQLPSIPLTPATQVARGALKLGIAVGILWWVARDLDLRLVLQVLRSAEPLPIGGALLLMFVPVAIAGWRWQQTLEVFGIHAPLPTLVKIAQIGQFFMLFFPGPSGDDLMRMLYISRIAKGRVGAACTSVLLDRALGFASVFMLAAFCIPAQWTVLATSRRTYWMAWSMEALGVAVCAGLCAYLLVAPTRTRRLLSALVTALPLGRFSEKIAALMEPIAVHKRTILRVLAAATLTQTLNSIAFGFAGRAVGIEMSVSFWLGFIPIVLAASAIPISVAGLGVREFLFVLFLRVAGNVSEERALAASFVVFAMTAVVSLAGGIVYLLSRTPADSAPSTSSAP